jgi:hypothetical protein
MVVLVTPLRAKTWPGPEHGLGLGGTRPGIVLPTVEHLPISFMSGFESRATFYDPFITAFLQLLVTGYKYHGADSANLNSESSASQKVAEDETRTSVARPARGPEPDPGELGRARELLRIMRPVPVCRRKCQSLTGGAHGASEAWPSKIKLPPRRPVARCEAVSPWEDSAVASSSSGDPAVLTRIIMAWINHPSGFLPPTMSYVTYDVVRHVRTTSYV